MRNIVQLYITDLKRIVTNWAALIIILALIALPSLYAWFNIQASWDPYGNTKGIPVAITNEDVGTQLQGQTVNVGDLIVQSLKKNKKLGWTFVDKKKALDMVKHGDAYASILIPKDFSKKMTSILEENPEKPVITYTVNEKINAIAPKITSTGATGIVQQISEEFIKTVSKTIFSIFNELGIELEKDLPDIKNMKNLIFRLENDIPKINQIVNTALNDINTAGELETKVRSNLPIIKNVANKGVQLTNELSDFINKNKEAVQNIIPIIKGNIDQLRELADTKSQIQSILQNYQNNPDEANAALSEINTRLNRGVIVIDYTTGLLEKLNAQSDQKRLSIFINQLTKLKSDLQSEIALNNQIITSKTVADHVKKRLDDVSNLASSKIADIHANFESQYVPAIRRTMDDGMVVLEGTKKVLTDAQNSMPDVERILKDASKGISTGKQTIVKLKKDLPAVEKKIREIAHRIREFDKKADINEIIRFLKHNVNKESEFLKNPILLKEHKLFPIPNYGSGMTPFFTTLSLWVGAMLLISLLTVEVENDQLKSYQVYFGRLFTFLTIAILQSLIATLGDMYLLHTYVADKPWFVLFGVVNSIIFMVMVYTFVSVFGNVGKALGIVLLVLQISGSGGTFPIQVAPRFFQLINPYLPFTYSISLMREATGGILWDIVQKDVIILSIFLIVSVFIGVTLKKFINQASEKMIKKVKESGLIH
ncbi:YhgE/Pip domain-containing protein [Heyndrickxia sp. FSL K6-6286]|uniref:YhgE/Pip domain-containing protein n=1 Tax=Heyndrickxia sp. FSL K6-6286 TaxID=2921510 RepID=UPI00315AB82E